MKHQLPNRLWSEDLGLDMEETLALLYTLQASYKNEFNKDAAIVAREINILQEELALINIEKMLTED